MEKKKVSIRIRVPNIKKCLFTGIIKESIAALTCVGVILPRVPIVRTKPLDLREVVRDLGEVVCV